MHENEYVFSYERPLRWFIRYVCFRKSVKSELSLLNRVNKNTTKMLLSMITATGGGIASI